MKSAFKRIFVNRSAIVDNRRARRVERIDVLTVAHFEDDYEIDDSDQRKGPDAGAYMYEVGTQIDIVHEDEVIASIVHVPDQQHGASVWIETDAELDVSNSYTKYSEYIARRRAKNQKLIGVLEQMLSEGWPDHPDDWRKDLEDLIARFKTDDTVPLIEHEGPS